MVGKILSGSGFSFSIYSSNISCPANSSFFPLINSADFFVPASFLVQQLFILSNPIPSSGSL